MAYQGPGRYRHYKGGEYEVLGLAVREPTVDKETPRRAGDRVDGDVDVIYRPLSPGSLLTGSEIDHWSRTLDDFNAMVDREHGQVPRFAFEESAKDVALSWKVSALDLSEALIKVRRSIGDSYTDVHKVIDDALGLFVTDHPPDSHNGGWDLVRA